MLTMSKLTMSKLKPTQKRRCEKCNSLQTYIVRKNKQLVCRSCGHKSNLENLEEEE